MKPGIFILLAIVVLSSCEKKRSDTRYYYAMDSLLSQQTKFLTTSRAKLTKDASIDGRQETKTYIPLNDTAWTHELDVFAELNDINKPANVGKYRIEKGIKDVNSNLLIYLIESNEKIDSNEKLPVVFLKVYYLDNLSNIRRIEGLYREESSLLKSSRQLSMEFQNINNKIVLTSYSITGGQKMLLGDTVQFSVAGMVTLP